GLNIPGALHLGFVLGRVRQSKPAFGALPNLGECSRRCQWKTKALEPIGSLLLLLTCIARARTRATRPKVGHQIICSVAFPLRINPPMSDATGPLLTDLYQLNMLQAYFEHGDTE